MLVAISLSLLGDLFPSLDDLSLDGIHSDLLHSALGDVGQSPPAAFVAESLASRLVRLRIKKCPLVLLNNFVRHFPRLRSLELTYCPPPSATLPGRLTALGQLTVLKVTRDEYRDVVDYADFCALLGAAPRLQEFHLVNAAIYVNSWAGNERRMMSEEEFLGEEASFF